MINAFFGKVLFPLLFLVLTLGGGALGLKEIYDDSGSSWPAFEAEGLAGLAARRDFIESKALASVPYKERLFDAYYYLQVLMGKREYNNFSVVKIGDGILNIGSFTPPDLSRVRLISNYYHNLKNITENAGGRLIVYSPPVRPLLAGKIDTAMPQMDLNPKIDVFLQQLREYGLDFVDARYSLRDIDELPADLLLYKTDISWTSQAAFAAFQDLVGAVSEKYGLELDPDGFYRDRRNYEFKTYPDLFLGRMGQETSALVTGRDDFTAIWPKFDNNYTVEFIESKGGYYKVEGGAQETIFYPETLRQSVLAAQSQPGEIMESPYNFYLHGLNSMVIITNEDHPERPSMLLIHDLFGLPPACFLAPLAGRMVLVNPLSEAYVPELDRLIADQKFDLVIIMHSAYTL